MYGILHIHLIHSITVHIFHLAVHSFDNSIFGREQLSLNQALLNAIHIHACMYKN